MVTNSLIVRRIIGIVAIILLIALIFGSYRREVASFIWDAWRGNPTHWRDYSIQLSDKVFVATLPDERLLLIALKEDHKQFLEASHFDETRFTPLSNCVPLQNTCKSIDTQKSQLNGKTIEKSVCDIGPQSPDKTIIYYCVEGARERITLSATLSAIPQFEPTVQSLLTQISRK